MECGHVTRHTGGDIFSAAAASGGKRTSEGASVNVSTTDRTGRRATGIWSKARLGLAVVFTFTDAPSDVRFPPDAAAAEKMSPPVCLVTSPHSISKHQGRQCPQPRFTPREQAIS